MKQKQREETQLDIFRIVEQILINDAVETEDRVKIIHKLLVANKEWAAILIKSENGCAWWGGLLEGKRVEIDLPSLNVDNFDDLSSRDYYRLLTVGHYGVKDLEMSVPGTEWLVQPADFLMATALEWLTIRPGPNPVPFEWNPGERRALRRLCGDYRRWHNVIRGLKTPLNDLAALDNFFTFFKVVKQAGSIAIELDTETKMNIPFAKVGRKAFLALTGLADFHGVTWDSWDMLDATNIAWYELWQRGLPELLPADIELLDDLQNLVKINRTRITKELIDWKDSYVSDSDVVALYPPIYAPRNVLVLATNAAFDSSIARDSQALWPRGEICSEYFLFMFLFKLNLIAPLAGARSEGPTLHQRFSELALDSRCVVCQRAEGELYFEWNAQEVAVFCSQACRASLNSIK
jgi:hypothetical protein